VQIRYATLDTCDQATGTVVVIDVIRAFTTAAYAFAAGAGQILLAGEVNEAWDLKRRFPAALLMGEVGGLPISGFDFANSPNELVGLDLSGKVLIQRTSSGTQGVVRSRNASHVFCCSFVNAGASARLVQQISPKEVTLVATGTRPAQEAVEDVACAEYVAALLQAKSPDPAPFLRRARQWSPSDAYASPALLDIVQRDMDQCLEVDRFDFGMQVQRREGLLVMQAVRI
jgi:2-phosphosulfolactate phosphatase